MFDKNNFTYHVDENECVEIGDNFHAHSNYSPIHRIVIVFDTKKKINDIMINFFAGILVGIFLTTAGASGVSKLIDNSVKSVQTTIKEKVNE